SGLAGSGACVGADVVDDPAPQSAQLAVSVSGDLQIDDAAVRLRGGGSVLTAAGGPCRSLLEAPRDERGEHLFREDHALRAEAAADILGDDTDFLLGQARH